MMIRLSFLNMNSNIYFAIPNNAQNDKLNNFLKEKILMFSEDLKITC